MGKKVEKALSAITTALVAVITVFALLIVAGKPFGVHAYAVLSGSMEPEYSTGSLIYVKEVPASQLGEGDVITFMVGKDATVTHRIVGVEAGEDDVTRLRTQGDANSTPDGELVHPDNVIGTPVLEIPMLGYAVNFIQFPPGIYIAISVGAIAVFLMFLPDLFPSRRDEDEGEGDEPRRGRHAAGGAQGQYPQNIGAHAQGAAYAYGQAAGSYACPQAGISYAHGSQAAGQPYGTNQVHPYAGSAPAGRTSARCVQHPAYANPPVGRQAPVYPPAGGDPTRQGKMRGQAPIPSQLAQTANKTSRQPVSRQHAKAGASMPQGMRSQRGQMQPQRRGSQGQQAPQRSQAPGSQARQTDVRPNATRAAADPRLGRYQAVRPIQNAQETHQSQARPARRPLT